MIPKSKRLFVGVLLTGAFGAMLGLYAAERADAWTSVHLSVTTTCDDYHTVAHVTADNSESLPAHVLSQTGNAWSVGDNIPKPSQTKNVTITGHTSFQVTVNYPGGDLTSRPSNTVTADVIVSCHPPTTVPTTAPPTTVPQLTTTTTKPATTSTTGKTEIGTPTSTVAPAAPVPVTPHFTG